LKMASEFVLLVPHHSVRQLLANSSLL